MSSKIIVLLLTGICLSFQISFSQKQKNKKQQEEITIPGDYHEILIIPFEDKMYNSKLDKDIALAGNLDFEQVRDRFRKGLIISLAAALNRKFETISFTPGDTNDLQAQSMIYAGIKYRYDLVEPKDDAKKKQPADQDIESTREIRDGQLVSTKDNHPRFMNTELVNKDLFNELPKRFKKDLFLFINQFDLLKEYVQGTEEQKGGFKNKIRVHFALYDKQGRSLVDGLAEVSYPNSMNDINEILSRYFFKLATEVQEQFPTKEE